MTVPVSVLIPAFNEAATLRRVLEGLAALPLDVEMIVVDDGSTDETPAILARWTAEHPDTTVLTQPNRGKGAAVRAAIARAGGDVCVIQDADLEYDPAEIPRLVAPILRDEADVVFGSRFAGAGRRAEFTFWQLVGNRTLSFLASLLFRARLSDIETGSKAFRTEAVRSLELREQGFGIEAELTAEISRRRLRVTQLPISYCARGYADGKKITWRDGLHSVRVLIAGRVRR